MSIRWNSLVRKKLSKTKHQKRTCYSNVSIGLALVDHLHHLLGTCHEAFGDALHERAPILVLVHRKVGFGNY